MILREWLDILEEFEIAMDGNEWLVTFHQSLIFPVSRWVRSVLIGLAEGGDCVPSDLKAELLHTFGISGTDIIENSFNWLREKARRDKAEKQSPMTQWQRTMASPFMEACDKRPLQLSAESDTLAPHTVSPDIFNASMCKCSFGDKLLSRFLEHCDGDAWPHPSPQASLLIPEFPRQLGQLAARVALSPGDAWLGFVPQNRQDWLLCPSEQSVFLRDMAALHPLSRVGLLYQTRGRGRCDSRRSTLAATSLDGIG